MEMISFMKQKLTMNIFHLIYVILLCLFVFKVNAKENVRNKSGKPIIVTDSVRFDGWSEYAVCHDRVLTTSINGRNLTTNIPESKHKLKENVSNKSGKSIIDIVQENLSLEEWSDPICRDRILATLINARNSTLHATWVLDSIQFPNGALYGSKYQLGNYDECMKVPWAELRPELRNKYCLADVKLTDAVPAKWNGAFDPDSRVENYVNTITKHGRPLNTITWGVCVPSICTKHGVATFVKVLFRSSVLSALTSNPVVTVNECQINGQKEEVGMGAVIFLYMLLTLFAVAVLSTWYLKSTVNKKTSKSLATQMAKCFCMNKNSFDLVKASADDIPVLHGMRALTAILFVYAHQVFFVNSAAVGNGLDVDDFIDKTFFLMHTDLMTDTFLLMSALLLARGLVSKQTLENPLMVLWKRYIRLIGPMALVVFYLIAVSVHLGDGPLWQRLAGVEQSMCNKTWWLSLLMLNNYIRSSEMCFITLWYVPADFQLTALGVALIYLCRYYPSAGRKAVMITVILSVLLPAYATFTRKLPGTILYNVETMLDIRLNDVFNSTYIRSHYRIGAYLVGLALGYFMTLYKPAQHRNSISKKTSNVLFVIFFIMAWVPWVIGGLLYTREYNATEAAIFAATHRIVWVLVMGALVLVSEYGNLSIVSKLLSWTAWVPLSRLSYGLYLIHPLVIQYNVFSARTPLRHHPFTMLSDSFGPVAIGYLLSFLMWLLVQAPISNLVNIFNTRSKTTKIEKSEDVPTKKNN